MLLRLLVALALGGCESWSILVGTVTHTGTVYDCGGGVEYCYHEDSAVELSVNVGLQCDESGISDRLWTGLTNLVGLGCYYDCDPARTIRGCNAHNGCYCPSSARVIPARMVGDVWVDLLRVRSQVKHDVCDSEWVQPAIHCGDTRWLKHDGCRWRCASIFERGAQQ